MSRIGVLIGSTPLALGGTAPGEAAENGPVPDSARVSGDAARHTVPVATPLEIDDRTPFGKASSRPWLVTRPGQGSDLVLMSRHGEPHSLAPHAINYRANIWLMIAAGVDAIIAVHTVGGIDPRLAVGDLVVPDQLIDYTWGRESTFGDELRHVDFTHPFSFALRQRLVGTAGERASDRDQNDITTIIHSSGTYACTQGPRLETAAEIVRLTRDGCTVVGMTAMPEAVLAREMEVPYASLCLVVNPAAGVIEGEIDRVAMRAASRRGAESVRRVLLATL